MEDTEKIPQLQLPIFPKQKLHQSKKYNKVINNFLVKSKNFEYLESCYRLKPLQLLNKELNNQKQNVFQFTQPCNINKSKTIKNETFIVPELLSPHSILKSQSLDRIQSQQKENSQNLSCQIKKEALQINNVSQLSSSSTYIPQPNLSSIPLPKLNMNSDIQNAILDSETVSTTVQLRSPSSSQYSSSKSDDHQRTYDQLLNRRNSLQNQNSDYDEIIQKYSKQTVDRDGRPYHLREISQSDKKQQIRLKKIALQRDIKLEPLSKENLLNLSQNTNIYLNTPNKSDFCQISQEQLGLINKLVLDSSQKCFSSTKFLKNNSTTDLIQEDNTQNINNPSQIQRKKNSSVHIDDRRKQQVIDDKYVLQSKIFQEMHNGDKFITHLGNIKKQQNQIKLLEDELNQYLPKPQPNSQTVIKLSNNITNSFQNYYNQVCNNLNEFHNSLQEKNNTFDFKSYYQQHQDVMKQQERSKSQIHNQFNAQNNYDQSSLTPTDSNHYKNLNQMQQFKAQQIYSLLKNLKENFDHFLEIKKSRKKVLKTLNQILGFNECIKNTVLEDDQISLKKDIDFREGFSQETWKLIHKKNINNYQNLQKIPIRVNNCIEYVPIDEVIIYFN